MARLTWLGFVFLAGWGLGGGAGIDARTRADSPWLMLERSDTSGVTIWAKRLSITDQGLPVVLREERQGFFSQPRFRYLITVDCRGRLQAVRQFWGAGESQWNVLKPLEWAAPDDALTLKIQDLACQTRQNQANGAPPAEGLTPVITPKIPKK